MTIIQTTLTAARSASTFGSPASAAGAAAGQAVARTASSFSRDAFVPRTAGVSGLALAQGPARDLPMLTGIKQLDDKRAELGERTSALDRRIALGEHPSSGPSLQAQKAQLQKQDQLLGSLRAGAEKLAGLPELDGADRARYLNLMSKAEGFHNDRSAARLEIEAKDIARNADRAFPADQSITNAQNQLADQLGYIQAQRLNLEDKLKSRTLVGEELAGAPAKSAQLNRDARVARELIAVADRVADRSLPAPARDVEALKAIMGEVAQGNVSQRRAMELHLKAEVLGR